MKPCGKGTVCRLESQAVLFPFLLIHGLRKVIYSLLLYV